MIIFTRTLWLSAVIGVLLIAPGARAQAVSAQRMTAQPVEAVLSIEQLDSLLAPIALYPDTLLSHILIAAGYPLEIVQARRFLQAHNGLSAEALQAAAQKQDWSASVMALLPFADILARLDQDLHWTQSLGEAFIADEGLVVERIQVLRHQAKDSGFLASNPQLVVNHEPQVIRIEPAQPEVIYVPQYDTRVVYGPWWHPLPPVSWPAYDGWHALYFGAAVWVAPTFYFSTFDWHRRHVLVHFLAPGFNPFHYPSHQLIIQKGHRWQHSPHHRRGAHYKVINRERAPGQGRVTTQAFLPAVDSPVRISSKPTSARDKTDYGKFQVNHQDHAPAQRKIANLPALTAPKVKVPRNTAPDNVLRQTEPLVSAMPVKSRVLPRTPSAPPAAPPPALREKTLAGSMIRQTPPLGVSEHGKRREQPANAGVPSKAARQADRYPVKKQ